MTDTYVLQLSGRLNLQYDTYLRSPVAWATTCTKRYVITFSSYLGDYMYSMTDTYILQLPGRLK